MRREIKPDLQRQITDLEKRVKELEARPVERHFHYYPPIYQQPYAPPVTPSIVGPYRIVSIGDPLPFPPLAAGWLSNVNETITWSGGELH